MEFHSAQFNSISGLPAVINVVPIPRMITNNPDKQTSVPALLRRLEEAGADVVGLNCSYGPGSILKAIKDVKAVCKVHSRGERQPMPFVGLF